MELTPQEIIESMCFVMPYEFRGRLSIEPYLIEAMDLYYNQAIEKASSICAPYERNEILKLKK